MTSVEDDTASEDLSARSRRGGLSRAELRELERLLGSSAALRAVHLVGGDVDRDTAVQAGDESLILRAADAALARALPAPGAATGAPAFPLNSRARRRRQVTTLLVVAASVLLSGLSAAILAGVVPSPFHVSVAGDGAEAAAPGGVPHRQIPKEGVARKPLLPEPAESAAIAEPAAPAAVPPDPSEAVVLSPAKPVVITSTVPAPSEASRLSRAAAEPTAAELFFRANAARRGGDAGRAERLYGELVAKYPGSDEARLGQVSLGKLLLATGQPGKAEREFRHYLSDGPGPLAEEALVSQAQSFERMKKASDEHAAWERLLSQYPKSVYAAQAKIRLGSLGRARPGR